VYFLELIFLFLFTIVPVLLSVAFFTLAERKVIAVVQRRKGPNFIFNFLFLWGFLQPIADGLKAILKELVFPKRIHFFLFLIGPLYTFLLSVCGWFLVPFSFDIYFINNDLSFLLFFVIASLGFYGVLVSSWASNSKYAMFAAFRSVAQLISYEIFLALNILPIIALTGSWNFISIVYQQKDVWNILIFLPLGLIFFVGLLAETNRIPFDLPEAEAEIVAGYNIEYSGFIFALFFLGEYSNMLINAMVICLIFFGGWLPFLKIFVMFNSFWLIIKTIFFCFLWIFVRATVPRYRYDQLMDLGWKVFLPITLGYFFLIVAVGFYFNSFPYTIQF
jgi:NADH-quinone oxidoreductase subunit H